MPDLGVARGIVRVEYQSTGADKVQKDTQNLGKYTDDARQKFDALAASTLDGTASLAKYQEVSARVGKANRDLAVSNAAVAKAQKTGAGTGVTKAVADQVLAQKAVKETTAAYENWLRVVSNQNPQLKFDGRNYTTQVQTTLSGISGMFSNWGSNLSSSVSGIGNKVGTAFSSSFAGTALTGLTSFASNAASTLEAKAGSLAATGAVWGKSLMGGIGTVGMAAAKGAGALISGALSVALLAGLAATVVAVGATIGLALKALSGGMAELQGLDEVRVKLQATGKSAKEISGIMQQLQSASKGTTYSLDALGNVAEKALSFGVKPGKELDTYLKNVQNMAAATGGSLDQMGDIMQRVLSQGKITGDTMESLTSQGIPVLKFAAEDAGISVDQMRAKMRDGSISAEQFSASLQKHLGGAAEAATKTTGGAFKQFNKTLEGAGATLLGPLFGMKTGDTNAMAGAINTVNKGIESLGNTFEKHQKGIIDFWRITGRVALGAAKGFTTVVQVIVTAVIDFFETLGDGIGWISQFGSTVASVFGADGVAKNMDDFAQRAHRFGAGVRQGFDKNLGKLNNVFDNASKGLDGWSDRAKAASGATGDLNDSLDPKPAITLSDALLQLGSSSEEVSSGIKGSQKDFDKLIETLQKKGASDEVITALTKLHEEYDRSGRSADALAKAIDDVNNSQVDAASSSSALIKSLRDVGALAGNAEESLSKYNETVDSIYDPSNNLVNVLDKTGVSLLDMSGHIDTATTNGRSLFKETDTLVKSMAELMASGADVDTTYANTSQTLYNLAAQFGITGTAADQFVQTYLGTPKQWEVQMSLKGKDEVQKSLAAISADLDGAKAKGDTDLTFRVDIDQKNAPALQKAVEQYGAIWKQYDPTTGQATIDFSKADIPAVQAMISQASQQDPAKFKTQLDVLTKRDDIVNGIAPPGNPLRIPAVIDVQGGLPGAPGDSKEVAPPPPTPIPTGPATRAGTGLPSNPVVDPLQPHGGAAPVPTSPALPTTPSGPTAATDLPGLMGALPNLTQDSAKIQSAIDQAKQLGQISADTSATLDQVAQNAAAQGQTLAQAFAAGIANGNEAVKSALLQLAQNAPDILGNSPAKYGPLSGSGWTYNRGSNFTKAFASGISSQATLVANATTNLANTGVSPMENRFGKFISDLQQFSDLGKSLSQFAQTAIQIGTSLAQAFIGNRKSYVPDPNAKRPVDGMGLSNGAFGGAAQRGYQNLGQPGAGTGPTNTTVPEPPVGNTAPPQGIGQGQQGVANYIIQSALARGFNRQQANWFATQGFGESGFKPDAQSPNGLWGGIFQFDQPTWAGAGGGNMKDAKQNIDNYFNLAKQRGLTPQDFTDPTQLGTQVSIGGPYHPENAAKGHRKLAEAGVQPFLQGFQADSGTTPAPNPAPQVGPGVPNAKGIVPPPGTRYDEKLDQLVPLNPRDPSGGGRLFDYTTGKWIDQPAPKSLPQNNKMAPTDPFAPLDQPDNAPQGPVQPPTVANVPGGQPTFGGIPIPGFGKDAQPAPNPLDYTQSPFPADQGRDHPLGTMPLPQRSPNVALSSKDTPTGSMWGYDPNAQPGSGKPFTQLPANTYGLPGGTKINYGDKGFPDWVYAVAKKFGIEASTYEGHQETKALSGETLGVPEAVNPQGLNRGIDWRGTPEALQAFANFVDQNKLGEQVIYRNPQTGQKTGFPHFADYSGDFEGHGDHVHTRFSQGFMPGDVDISKYLAQAQAAGQTGQAGQLPMDQNGRLPISLPQSDSGALQSSADSINQLPSKLGAFLQNDPSLVQAYNAAKGIGGPVSQETATGLLQNLDKTIAQQQGLKTPEGDAMAKSLGDIRSGVMSQSGLKEGESQGAGLISALSSAGGLVADGFQVFDDVIKSIESTQQIVAQLNRGVANTEDIYNMVDKVQAYIQLGADISRTVGDGLQLASQIAGSSGGADMGASAALGVASTIAQAVSQAFQAVNTMIDIAQEVYRITTKYATRNLLNWLGFPGATDMNYLLETNTGLLKAYTSANPDDKHLFNDFNNLMNGNQLPPQKAPVVNSFTIYQGPGQDPRDTMSDSMFMVRSAGVSTGSFGYASV